MIKHQKHAPFWLAAATLITPSAATAHDVAAVRHFVHDERVQTETSGAGVSDDTQFAIASVGKTFTAVAILALAADGILSLDDPAAKWLPTENTEGFGGLSGVSIRRLLTMSSGLPDYYADDYLDDALDDPDNVQQPKIALSYAFDQPPLFGPGDDFDYSNTNYVLLGLIIERAAGQTYADALNRLVFQPACMTRSFVFGSRPLPGGFTPGHEDGQHIRAYYQGQGFGDGGAISSAADLVRFYRALFIQRALLPPAMLTEMLHDPIGEGYGMGVDVSGGFYGHSGGDLGFASDIRFDPETGAIAVILIADGDAETYWAEDRLNNVP